MTADITPERIEELRRLAEAADRAQRHGGWSRGTAGTANVVSYDGDDIIGVASVPRDETADYIAAANPQTMLALLDALEEACRDEYVTCPECDGRGYHGTGVDGPCDTCYGQRKIPTEQFAVIGVLQERDQLRAENERLREVFEAAKAVRDAGLLPESRNFVAVIHLIDSLAASPEQEEQ